MALSLFLSDGDRLAAGEAEEMNQAQHSAWETIQRAHAIANGVYVVVVNRVGREGKLNFWGQSFVADPFGRIIAKASSDKEEVLVVDCDLEQDRRDAPELAVSARPPDRFSRAPRVAIPGTRLEQMKSPMPTPAELGYRMPAEWQRHTATWLTWPKDPETWPDRVPQVEEIFLQMMAALAPHEIVNLLVDDEATGDLRSASVALSRVRTISATTEITTVDSWIRDYGPNFLVSDKLQFVADSRNQMAARENDKLKSVGQAEQPLAYNDWIFNAWGNKYEVS